MNRTIIKNIFSLTTAEFVNKSLTFLYTAYLARIILTDGLGSITLGQYIANFFLIFNAGLDTYSIKLLSKNKENLKGIVDVIFSTRFFLSLASYILLIALVVVLNKPDSIKLIILIMGLTLLAQVNYINWVYMALEKFEIIAIRLIITSFLNLAGIFLLVKGVNDVWIAAIIIAGSQLINAAWMIVYYFKKYNSIRIVLNVREWFYHIKTSIPISLTFIIIAFYNNIGITLVGILVTTNYLYQNGILIAAVKLQLIAFIPIAIFQQAFFPQLARADTEEKRNDELQRFTKIIFLAGSVIAVTVFFYSGDLIRIAFGNAFAESGTILRILSFAIVLMYVNTSYSIPLIAWGYEKSMLKVVSAGAVINLIINLTCIPVWGMYATAFASITTEIVIFILLLILIRKTTGKTYIMKLVKNLLTVVPVFFIPYYFLHINFIFELIISLVVAVFMLFITRQLELSQFKALLKR